MVGLPPSPVASNALSRKRRSEAGYILLGVLILLAVFLIAMAVAAPIVAKDIERDKEVEAVQRGKQYTRAIKLYYKRYGSYPTNIKALENTNNIRYLRKRYTDPITGKDDWRLIHVGEAKVPVMGFFGQPLQGAGTGSATTGLMNNGTGGIGGSSTNSSFGGTSTGSSFGTPIGGSTDSSGGSTDGSTGAAAGGGTMPGMGNAGGATNGTASTGGFGSSSTTGGFGTSNTTGTNGFNGSTTTGSGGSGFDGGGPIVGVGIPMSKKSMVVYHKQDAFNKWEFTYDPLQDQQMISNSSISGATPVGGTPGVGGSSTTGSGTGFGTPFSSTGSSTDSGSSNTGTTSTTPPTNPTTPNQ